MVVQAGDLARWQTQRVTSLQPGSPATSRSRQVRTSALKIALTATLSALALAGCGAETDSAVGGPTITAAPDEPSSPSEVGPADPRVLGTVATGLAVPWGIAFLPDGSAVVTERDSRRVLAISDQGGDGFSIDVIGELTQTAPSGEGGLLGVAVSPQFDAQGDAADQLLYFYLTTASDNRVVRATYDGQRLGEPTVVLDGIPRGPIHDGGRLAFGPDGDLYVSTGETGDKDLAQDPESLAGKILRITADGEPAAGNPDPGSPVWSSGHRNVQGLAFDAQDQLWASEFGASDADELNLIESGANYGWPEVEGRGDDPDFVDPAVVWSTEDASPSGLAFDDGYLWMAALRGARLWRIPVAGDETGSGAGEDAGVQVGQPRGFFVGDYGRLRAVVAAPDGNLWVATSNRDGRGTPKPDDDQILIVDPSP